MLLLDGATPLSKSPLPKWNFGIIEYPGYVQDEKRAIKTLGGLKAIERGFGAKDLGSLELRYNVDNDFIHPLIGDIINTSNLVLKVTTRRHKTSGALKTEVEIVGLATKTCRFRSLADFQYFPDFNDPMVHLLKSVKTWDVDTIENSHFPPTNDASFKSFNIPPPIFSRVEWSQNYSYRQNEAIVKVMVQATEGEQPVMKLINRHKREKFVSVTFQGQNSEAPSEPPAEITKHLDTLPAVSIQKLRDLFEKRPAWTRLAISNNLTAAESKDFKLLLPTVAYVINSGPWRDCWVRYGYDPRKHKDAHLYQIIDFRNISQPGKHISKRAVRLRGIGDSSERVGQKIQTDNDRERSAKRSHIFDGTEYTSGAQFQLVDVTDPDLNKIIQSKGFCRETFDDKDGWIDRSLYESLRDQMKRKMARLSGRPIEETSEDEDNEEESASEQEELANDESTLMAEENVTRARLILDDMDENMNSKVNDLMANLGGNFEDEGESFGFFEED